MLKSIDRQYDAINHYDTIATVEPTSEAATEGSQLLKDAGMQATPVYSMSTALKLPDGQSSVATMIVPEDEDGFAQLKTIIPTNGSNPNNTGVWISEAYQEHMGAMIGDSLEISDGTGALVELPIAGFYEHHLFKYEIVIDQDTYLRYFGTSSNANQLFIDTKGKGAGAAKKVLHKAEGYVAITDDYNTNKNLFGDFSTISRIVVVVYLVLATVMAACVLLNLNFMFVDEKKRELIVLMICGFSSKEAKGYIWHDSVVLTALGILLGLALGSAAGGLTVRSIEDISYSFMHGISWLAIGVGIVGSIILATSAVVIALRRIDRFDLTDINRF